MEGGQESIGRIIAKVLGEGSFTMMTGIVIMY
jgi:hypothetical protein